MMRQHRLVFARLARLLFSLALLSTVGSAQANKTGYADAVLGRWDLTVQGRDGAYPSWLEVRLRKEIELMGSFVGHFGSLRYLAQVEYKDGDLYFRVPVQYERGPKDLEFRGKLAGDKLAGTTEDENGRTINWTAVRAPELSRTAAPKWGKAVELFNGKDLTGWQPRSHERGNCWIMENGAMTNKVPCVDIVSEQKFTDFKLHVEFNIVAGSNSGVYLRGRHEVQINDDSGRERDSLRMGGLYGFIRPVSNASGKPGEWQTYDITLVGRRVTIVLNGKTVIENEEIPGITGGALDSDEGAPGPIMLQGDHGKVSFRKVTMTPAK